MIDNQTLLTYIRGFIKEKRYAPSLREMIAGMHTNSHALQKALRELEADGFIRRGKHQGRALAVIEKKHS